MKDFLVTHLYNLCLNKINFTFIAFLIVPLRLNGTAKLHKPDINTFPFPLSTLSEANLYSLPESN